MKEKVSTSEEQENIKAKPCSRSVIKRINTFTDSLVRYSGPFLKVDNGGSQTKRPMYNEIDDDAQGLTLTR